MYLVGLLRFGSTDYCVGMHSLKVITYYSYLHILSLFLCYNSVINFNVQMKKGILPDL